LKFSYCSIGFDRGAFGSFNLQSLRKEFKVMLQDVFSHPATHVGEHDHDLMR
jgi:hypothetical protein